jgi:MerR family transcriptional regulator, light-induced transcriptional regulator
MDALRAKRPKKPDPVASVAALEKATGIASATLRMWERRYGFPHPSRDARGERVYDAVQVDKLRLIAKLMLRGGRPGDLVVQSVGELQARLKGADQAAGQIDHPMLHLLKALDHTAVMQQLLQQLSLLGLQRFVCEVVAGTNVAVGDAWACGLLEPREEHLYSECLQQVLRAAIAGLPLPEAKARPRVVLATPAGEQHGLGLLMVQALLSEQRCLCLPLGRSLAADQVGAAASTWHADVIAISASEVLPARSVLAFLQELHGTLGPNVAIWAGGSSKALRRPELEALPAVSTFQEVQDVIGAVAAYREKQ